MPLRFLDTNILLRYLTRDDEVRAQSAVALLTSIEQDEEKVVTSPMVIFETVFTMQTRYKASRQQIKELVLPIVDMRSLQLPGKSVYRRAFDLYVGGRLSFADAYNVAYMEADGLTEVYTWDRDFDRVPGIRRIEPPKPK